MDALIHVACLLRLYSCFQDDLLRLRVLTLMVASCLIVYFATREEPLLSVVVWNFFFLTVNLVQIGLALSRRRRRVTPRERSRGATGGTMRGAYRRGRAWYAAPGQLRAAPGGLRTQFSPMHRRRLGFP